MELFELVARESARDLVARYNACGDANQLEEMLSLFADDAVLDVGAWGRHEGIGAIRAFLEGVRRSADEPADGSASEDRAEHFLMRHLTATHRIDVEGPDAARGQCYFAVLGAEGLDHWGRYLDRYARRGDRWLFEHREVIVDGTTPGGWADARRSALEAP
jgi:hypothetical protein